MIKLKLLLDENIGGGVVGLLREQGLDAKSILEDSPGAEDLDILKQAVSEQRILVTLDKDFGKLIFLNSNKHVGVIFLRLQKETVDNIFKVLWSILKFYGSELSGKFVTASEYSVRIR